MKVEVEGDQTIVRAVSVQQHGKVLIFSISLDVARRRKIELTTVGSAGFGENRWQIIGFLSEETKGKIYHEATIAIQGIPDHTFRTCELYPSEDLAVVIFWPWPGTYEEEVLWKR